MRSQLTSMQSGMMAQGGCITQTEARGFPSPSKERGTCTARDQGCRERCCPFVRVLDFDFDVLKWFALVGWT